MHIINCIEEQPYYTETLAQSFKNHKFYLQNVLKDLPLILSGFFTPHSSSDEGSSLELSGASFWADDPLEGGAALWANDTLEGGTVFWANDPLEGGTVF